MNFDQNVENLLGPLYSRQSAASQVFTGVVVLALIMYAAQIAPDVPEYISVVFLNTYFKIFACFLILYLAKYRPSMALLVAVCFVLTLNYVNSGNFELYQGGLGGGQLLYDYEYDTYYQAAPPAPKGNPDPRATPRFYQPKDPREVRPPTVPRFYQYDPYYQDITKIEGKRGPGPAPAPRFYQPKDPREVRAARVDGYYDGGSIVIGGKGKGGGAPAPRFYQQNPRPVIGKPPKDEPPASASRFYQAAPPKFGNPDPRATPRFYQAAPPKFGNPDPRATPRFYQAAPPKGGRPTERPPVDTNPASRFYQMYEDEDLYYYGGKGGSIGIGGGKGAPVPGSDPYYSHRHGMR